MSDEPRDEPSAYMRRLIETYGSDDKDAAAHLSEVREDRAAEQALRDRGAFSVEMPKLPDGRGAMRIDVVPAKGVEPDDAWIDGIPARSRLRLTRRFETRFVSPVPHAWEQMPALWLVRMWEGAEPA